MDGVWGPGTRRVMLGTQRTGAWLPQGFTRDILPFGRGFQLRHTYLRTPGGYVVCRGLWDGCNVEIIVLLGSRSIACYVIRAPANWLFWNGTCQYNKIPPPPPPMALQYLTGPLYTMAHLYSPVFWAHFIYIVHVCYISLLVGVPSPMTSDRFPKFQVLLVVKGKNRENGVFAKYVILMHRATASSTPAKSAMSRRVQTLYMHTI